MICMGGNTLFEGAPPINYHLVRLFVGRPTVRTGMQAFVAFRHYYYYCNPISPHLLTAAVKEAWVHG